MTTITQDASVETQTFSIDPAHSQVGFAVRHLGFSKVRGAFEKFEGNIRFDPDDIGSLEVEVAILADSVTTNDEKRDEHLRSEDFFDVEEYPDITFKSTGVKAVTERQFVLVGEFTLHGVTREIELTGEFLGESKDPWGGTRVGFEAGTTINRNDFDLNWNVALEAGGWLVGEDVELMLEIQAVKQ